jgi:hypothetical protein
MNKRVLLTILLIATILSPARAVLKEQNLENTLSILRTELTNYHTELERQSGFMKEQQTQVVDKLFGIMNKSSQNSLMLYSQRPEYVFDLAYACHEATEQYHDYKKNVLPFRNFITKTNSEIARYDSLINTLSSMHVASLNQKALIDKNVCLTLAINIRHTLNDNSNQFNDYIGYYQSTESQLKHLNDYANKRYSEIQNNIFSNAGDNYFKIISKLGMNVRETRESIESKYFIKTKVPSQWDSRLIFGLFAIMGFYGFIACFLNILSIRFLVPKRFRTESFMSKRTCIIMASSVVSLAIILGLTRFIFSEQNFIIMASGLLVEYTWLLGVILISLLLRLDGKQIASAFRIYSPLIFIGLVVIAFRIILIPNDLVNIIFSPILLICTI